MRFFLDWTLDRTLRVIKWGAQLAIDLLLLAVCIMVLYFVGRH